MVIESLSNAQVKHAIHLRRARHRRKSGEFLIDGHREIELAAKADIEISKIFVTELQLSFLASDLQSKALLVSERVAERVCYGQQRDIPLAIAKTPAIPLRSVELKGLILVLDRTEKPGNLGACLRTAQATGVNTVVLTDPICEVFNDNAIRASRGAIFSTQLAQADRAEFLSQCEADGVSVVCARVDGSQRLWDLDFSGNLAVVFGNEADGLGPEWRGGNLNSFTIPMASSATDSLNLSISAAVTLFEAVRQRT